MRVTNSLITHDTIARLQQNQKRVAEAQERVTTGLRVRKMSDDPSDASSLLQTLGSLRALAQYRRNVQALGSRLDAEEGSLDQVTQLLTRAKELAAGQLGANASADSRAAAALEVQQLLEQTVAVANTKFDDEFLFGGANSAASQPFDRTQTGQSPLYVSLQGSPPAPLRPQGTRAIEIAAGQTMPGVHDGDTVFVQTGVLQSLHDLQGALASNSPAGIDAAMSAIDGAMQGVQSLVGDVGARQNRIETLGTGFDALQQYLEARKSDLREVDMETAITEMLNRQTAYQAAMMAASKVMGMSLTDYLR